MGKPSRGTVLGLGFASEYGCHEHTNMNTRSEMEKSTRIAVLVSGFGSNLQAILDAVEDQRLPGVEVALVVSNRRTAHGIQRAIQHGVPVLYFPFAPYRRSGRPRQAYDADLAALVRAFDVTWAVLA